MAGREEVVTRAEKVVPGAGFEPVTLSTDEIARFARDGFLVVDRPVVGPEDLAEVRKLLDDLFDRFDELPRKIAYDLGDVKHHDGPRQIPEINRTREIEPRLAATAAFIRCRDLARQLLSEHAECVYDHAIYKSPHNAAATEWHQDLAYSPAEAGRDAVHIWLTLQDVTEANGCMQYIPDNGRRRLLSHRKRGGNPLAHALVADGVDPSAAVVCPIEAGMVTMHRLTTLHYTGPNDTDAPRLAWVLIFQDRPRTTWTSRSRAALSRLKRSFVASTR